MAKWTGNFKAVKRLFRRYKLLIEMQNSPGEGIFPDTQIRYWCEVDAERLSIIALDLHCRRSEVKILTEENARLRAKLIRAGSDPKPDDEAGCKRSFGEEELEMPSFLTTVSLKGDPVNGLRVVYDFGNPVHTPNPIVLTEEEKTRPAHPPKGR